MSGSLYSNETDTVAGLAIGIVGIGLIGGSIAKSLRHKCSSITAYDVDAEQLAVALAHGVIDRATDRLIDIAHCHCVFVCVPPDSVVQVMEAILQADNNVIVTDCASVKQPVVDWAQTLPDQQKARVTPGHPIAGTQFSGFEASIEGLFEGALTVLIADTGSHAAYDTVKTLWVAMGSRVTALQSNQHDKLFAYLSHLPHLLAWALLATLLEEYSEETIEEFQGAGFRGMTRIAGSSSQLWGQIFQDNRLHLLESAQRLQKQLVDFTQLVEDESTFDTLCSKLENVAKHQVQINRHTQN